MPDARYRLSAPSCLVLLLLVALAPVAARADQSTDRAKQLFNEGTTLFNVGEFDKAIDAWQQGYKEKPDPGFLYNIGQAYRLKGDNAKAIFFYRGYLRNSPKAANKADVEAKIAQLQKALEGKPGATPAPGQPPPVAPAPVAPAPVTPAPTPAPVTPPPPVAAAPAPVGPAAVAPPPVEAPPLAGGAGASAPPVAEFPAATPPEAPLHNRPIDLGLALGFDSWTSGVRGNAPARFAFDLAGGYTFGDVYGASSFRLGARLDATSLSEPSGSVKFTSLLLEPGLRVRLMERRLYLSGALGIGALFLSGVKSGSTLLVVPPPNQTFQVPSTVTVLELRPAVGLQLHLTDALVASMTPSIAYSPKKDRFYENMGRFQLLFGLSLLI
jgi:hypothetical protein